MEVVRFQGKWYTITRKPYEPEKQSYTIAWYLIKNPEMSQEEAYAQYFEKLKKEAKVLYPSFRKDDS